MRKGHESTFSALISRKGNPAERTPLCWRYVFYPVIHRATKPGSRKLLALADSLLLDIKRVSANDQRRLFSLASLCLTFSPSLHQEDQNILEAKAAAGRRCAVMREAPSDLTSASPSQIYNSSLCRLGSFSTSHLRLQTGARSCHSHLATKSSSTWWQHWQIRQYHHGWYMRLLWQSVYRKQKLNKITFE